MKEQYINAVLEMLKTGKESEVVLSGLKDTLNKRGHLSLEASILASVLRVIEAKSIDETVVTVASKESYNQQAAAIAAALKNLKANIESTIKIDPTVIGGFIAEANNTRHDASYKTKLISLYRSLTQ